MNSKESPNGRTCLALVAIAVCMLAAGIMMGGTAGAGPNDDPVLDSLGYLPLVVREVTPTYTPTPTATPTPTPTPTRPPATSGNVNIIDIFYDGSGSAEPDEFVTIRNDDSFSIQLEDWTLRDIANHVFVFPDFVMQPGQVCRVYTNEYHSLSCGFNYENGWAIWNNSGDCAYLRNSAGASIDTYCY